MPRAHAKVDEQGAERAAHARSERGTRSCSVRSGSPRRARDPVARATGRRFSWETVAYPAPPPDCDDGVVALWDDCVEAHLELLDRPALAHESHAHDSAINGEGRAASVHMVRHWIREHLGGLAEIACSAEQLGHAHE